MPVITDLVASADPRVTIARAGDTPVDGACVLLWVSRTKRATANPAANVAVAVADALGLPVVALFCLDPAYPGATWRSFHFMAQGLDELPDAFAARGIGWELRAGDPIAEIPRAVAALRAAAVITDLDPLRTGRLWRERIARDLAVPMVVVDADTVVPSALFPKEEWAPRTIRPKLHKALPEFLQPIPDPRPRVASAHRAGPAALALLETAAVDRSVAPVAGRVGGETAARARLERFLARGLPRYHDGRNTTDDDGSSGLSAFLHFGQLSPTTVLLAARDALAAGRTHDEAWAAFVNELLVQRELAINFALRNPDYDRYEGITDWGRKTLADHAGDPRPAIYTTEQLAAGDTRDPLWNAAQRQLVHEGFMPNRLRMYWAKQFVHWTASPEEAYETAKTFNDRWFLDGRDANGYTGVAWSIGGRHDRPFPPNKPVIGLVRPMGAKGMAKYFDVDAYVREIRRRHG